MRPGDIYWPRVKEVWETISIHDGAERFENDFRSAPFVARTLFAAHWCDSEVCNGGFDQFFYNSTGVLAPEAVAAYRLIGMPQLAAVVDRALNWFDKPYPRERSQRKLRMTWPKGGRQFGTYDDEFYRLKKSENGGFLAAADAYALSDRVDGS